MTAATGPKGLKRLHTLSGQAQRFQSPGCGWRPWLRCSGGAAGPKVAALAWWILALEKATRGAKGVWP